MFDKALNMFLNWLFKNKGCFIFKSVSISKVIYNLRLGKTKKKGPNELQNSWTNMLLNLAQSNVSQCHWNISKHISRRFTFYVPASRVLFAHRLYLVMFCVIIITIWWDISNSCLAWGQSAFLWIFQKNCIDSISSKS